MLVYLTEFPANLNNRSNVVVNSPANIVTPATSGVTWFAHPFVSILVVISLACSNHSSLHQHI